MTVRPLQILGALVLGALLLSVGYYTGQATAPGPKRAPADTDSAATNKPDTSDPVATPLVVTVYDTVRKTHTRVETMRVPVPMQVEGVISERPIRRETRLFGPDEFTLTYFDHHARRYKQRSYTAGRAEWALWPEVEIRTTPHGMEATPAAGLRWRDWALTAGYTFAADTRGVTVGLRWQPVRATW